MHSYDLDVFINCPFDDGYSELFDAILFAVYSCGFRPRCALEVEDSSDIRIRKIEKIIEECRFGIHDISRTDLDETNELPRFNMPLELGIFLGAKSFGSSKQKLKSALIFDIEEYRYQKFLSDISGQDIRAHSNCPKVLIRKVRNMLNSFGQAHNLPGATSIIRSYESFQENLPHLRSRLALEQEDVTYADQTRLIEQWLKVVG